MYKVFFTVLILLLSLTTICAATFRPQMHKKLFAYDADYKIEVKDTSISETKSLPQKNNTTKQIKETKTIQNRTIVQKVSKPSVQKKTVSQKTSNTPVVQKSVKKYQPQSITNKSTSTQQQEVILWNKWRSDLQNKIMTDVKLPIIEQGTVFKFKFDVDKYGKISNLSTWSTSPRYTPYAIQYIAPVIKSYQGRSILDFPAGSNRMVTTVEGGWKISQTSKYSTPADYKDIEKIRN